MLRELKKKLRVLIRETSGTNEGFAKALAALGYHVSRPTVSRWVDPANDSRPDAFELRGIAELEPRISIDWLLGLKPPSSHKEHSIEELIRGRVGKKA